ncbi:unnamed protein product [Brassica oleracea]
MRRSLTGARVPYASMLTVNHHYMQRPTSRFTYLKALASKTYVVWSTKVYLLCRALEDKRISSWWMVDLGEDDQMMGQAHTQGPGGFRYLIYMFNSLSLDFMSY